MVGFVSSVLHGDLETSIGHRLSAGQTTMCSEPALLPQEALVIQCIQSDAPMLFESVPAPFFFFFFLDKVVAQEGLDLCMR